MTERDNSKNLTIVEVVIVVFVCLFLLAVVPPAFQKSRIDSSRVTCGRNLSEIGKAMIIYANDYDGELPCAGGGHWTHMIPNWMANNRFEAYGLNANGRGGQATITSSFYLLVKYLEVSPKSFICPGDEGATEFKPSDYGERDSDILKFWDFGLEPSKHCSYSYHMPYDLYTLSTSSEPGMAVASDRNPWINSPATKAKDLSLLYSYDPEGGKEEIRKVNAIAHREEGQNVLFLDGHVNFEESPLCGINDDNIYTFWDGDGGDIRQGNIPILSFSLPNGRLDSFLVNEPAPHRATVTKQAEALDTANLKKTSVVATLDCPVPEHQNVIWCSTFQIAWDKFKNDIIGKPVKVPGAEELAASLNRAEVSEKDLEKESFYATAGFVGKGIIKQIQKEMKKRFPSAPVSVSGKLKRSTDAAVLYSYLDIDLKFKYPFYTEDSPFIFEDSEGTHKEVQSFCNNSDGFGDFNQKHVHEQIDILYYKSGNKVEPMEFAIDLCKYTSPYQVVVALVSQSNTLRETLSTVEQKISEFKEELNYEVLRKIRTFGFADIVTVPDILYKLTHQFAELKDRPFENSQVLNCSFMETKQMIDFSLSRTSVTYQNDAIFIFWPLAQPPQPRRLLFNKPFLIYVKKRQGGTDPFFVMWVDNAELMNEFESK